MITNEQLDFWMEEIKDTSGFCKNSEEIISKIITDKILPLLQELKERRESELRPADKFLSNTPAIQFEHIVSELGEAKIAMVKKEMGMENNLVEELADLQMSCETMLAILGFDEQQRREARKKVIEKNRSRGHYEGNTK